MGGLTGGGKRTEDLFKDDPPPPHIEPPPPPVDFTDEEVQKARAAMIRRQLIGNGMASTFLTGSLGDLTPPPTTGSAAGGY